MAQPLHNQLLKVNDVAGNTPALGDLKDQGSLFDNYNYDEIGNLVQDSTEGIDKITWNLQGKVQEVEFLASTGKPNLQYTYDPMGNRLSKTIVGEKSTIYVRDPQGNVLSVYEHRLELSPTARVVSEQIETMIYGSSRLGTKKCTQVIKIDSLSVPTVYISERTCLHHVGHKHYDLSNHLGNVLATVTDKKIGHDTGSDDQADYYTAATVNSQFYYVYGWNIPSRQVNPQKARHGYNGMEKDIEISSGSYTTHFRALDTRIGRWLSVDPVIKPSWTPYNSMSNNPISRIDPLGDNDYFDREGNFIGRDNKKTDYVVIINGNNSEEYSKNVALAKKDLNAFLGSKPALQLITDVDASTKGGKALIQSVFTHYFEQENGSIENLDEGKFRTIALSKSAFMFTVPSKSRKTRIMGINLINNKIHSALSTVSNIKVAENHEYKGHFLGDFEYDAETGNYNPQYSSIKAETAKDLIRHANIYIESFEDPNLLTATPDFISNNNRGIAALLGQAENKILNKGDTSASIDDLKVTLDRARKLSKEFSKKLKAQK